MVTILEVMPEILTFLCVFAVALISRKFTDPIEEPAEQSLLNKSDFLSLQEDKLRVIGSVTPL